MRARLLLRVTGAATALLLAGCADARPADPRPAAKPRQTPPSARAEASSPSSTPPEPSATPEPPPRPEPLRSYLSVPRIGVEDFPVVRYRGRPDDAPGTRIQNAGPMASPRGERGGVGPGEVGNFIVTGHRTSHTMPFADLPDLAAGDRVRVRSGEQVHVYRITRTRWTSFREPASRAAQEAPVPGATGRGADPGDDHALHLRDAGGPCRRQLLVGPLRQPRAPHRQDRRPGPLSPRLSAPQWFTAGMEPTHLGAASPTTLWTRRSPIPR